MRGMSKRIIFILAGLLLIAGGSMVAYSFIPRPLKSNALVRHFLPTWQSFRKATDFSILYYMFLTPRLPEYHITINKKDTIELLVSLPQNTFSGHLTEEFKNTNVKGVFFDGTNEREVRLRFRGYNPVHWSDKKKSWRVEFLGNNLFHGMRVMNLVVPEDRDWIAAAFNMYRGRKLGLTMPEVSFVNLVVNNQQMGIYVAVEGWSPEFLQKNKKPVEGAYLYGTKDGEPNDIVSFNLENIAHYWEEQLHAVKTFGPLENLLRLGKSGTFNKALSLIDVEQYAQLTALMIISSNDTEPINMRLYYNPETKLFEVLPSEDISIFCPDGLPSARSAQFLKSFVYFPQVEKHAREIVATYTADKRNLEDDLAYFDALWEETKRDIFRDTNKIPLNREVERDVARMRDCLTQSFEAASGR